MNHNVILIKTKEVCNLPTPNGRGSLLDMPNTVAGRVGEDIFIWHKPSGVQIAAKIQAIHPNDGGTCDIIYTEGKCVPWANLKQHWKRGPGWLRYISHPVGA